MSIRHPNVHSSNGPTEMSIGNLNVHRTFCRGIGHSSWGESQSLPTGEFDWLTEQEIADLDITTDLCYPSELHDLHNNIENLRKRVNVKLVNNKTKLSKLIASPSFDYFRKFSEDLAAVDLKKTKLYLNRPIYVGFSILDLSKVFMYQFHCEYMKPKCGCNVKLLFTDTESLCCEIKTDDIYQDMLQDIDLFDTSEYGQNHSLCSLANKKVLGKMKDETHGFPIQEFIGLRPKMYSILYTENDKLVEKKTAKGTNNNNNNNLFLVPYLIT